MTTKTFHGFMLWAVPRFHRSEAICPTVSKPERSGGLTHQFATLRAEDAAVERPVVLTRETATCH